MGFMFFIICLFFMLTVADFYGLAVYIILYIAKLVNLFFALGEKKKRRRISGGARAIFA